jgi:sodium-dependent dicarboxylate transporter 2/3/5
MATLIGTPPNLILAGIVQETYGIEITFLKWFMFGLPVSLILLAICWKYLTEFAFSFKQKAFPGGKSEINKQLKSLGKISYEEKMVLLIFIGTAFAWITRSFLLQKFIPNIDDTIIAVIAGIILFVLPASKEKSRKLINWEEAVKLPWGILLLFGGGLALAQGFKTSGLAEWIGGQMTLLEGASLFFLLLFLITLVNFLTEITSNLATTAMILPILAPLSLVIDVHPFMLMVGATVAASCAFMLPVATPPNAVVFGSGYLRIPDMVKSGIWMNLFSIFFLTLMVYFLLPLIWGIDPHNITDFIN